MTSNFEVEGFHFGSVIEAIENIIPLDANALTHVETRVSWGQLKHRSNNLIHNLRRYGLKEDDKIGFYMRNCNEYMETLVATFKGGFTHVNVNFRYLDDELYYIIDNSDSKAIVFSPEFTARVESIKDKFPANMLWIQTGDEQSVPSWAISYDRLINDGEGAPYNRSKQNAGMLFLYTGGTTGMPKGVMWSHRALYGATARGFVEGSPESYQELAEAVFANHPNQRQIPVCPLMHGTGLFTAMNTMLMGGSVVTLPDMKFSAESLWDAVDKEKIQVMAIVGDAFGKPMLKALQDNPGKWDISSVVNIVSSGVMFSQEVKDGLLSYNENMAILDSFGASEGVGLGTSVATKSESVKVAKFMIGPNAKVFREHDFAEVHPGSDEVGYIAVSGYIPEGYYKDEAKTAKVFPVIQGKRWSMPGDFCTVEADGSIKLLGRGSACINSGGEKIYPEEIEEALKKHDTVKDALVVGLPSEKWGQMVVAVVSPEIANQTPSEKTLKDFCKANLAAYKTPKYVLVAEDLRRAANGKADYKFIREYAVKSLEGTVIE